MLYIPTDRKISAIPDLDRLPAKIYPPRDRSYAMLVLVITSAWLSIAVLGVAFIPDGFFPVSHTLVSGVVYLLAAIALWIGFGALRRYAAEDEVTISNEGIHVRRYGWLRRIDQYFDWKNLGEITHTSHENKYESLSVSAEGEQIPLLVGRNREVALKTLARLRTIRSAGPVNSKGDDT